MNCTLFFLLFLIFVISYGIVFHYITGEREGLCIDSLVTKGFVTMLAIFEIVFFPNMLLKASFTSLFISFSVVSLIIFCVALYVLLKKKVSICTSIREKIDIKILILFIFVLLLSIYIAWVHFDNFDDGYYIAVSNIALEENAIILNDNSAYTGNDYFTYSCTRPTINSWELLVAYFCKLLALHPAIMFHTILPIVLIPLFIVTASCVFRKIFRNKNEWMLALVIYIVMAVMWDGSMQLVSPYFTVGAANGKALMWYLVFPLIAECGMELYERKAKKHTWATFAIIPLAATASTATGIYTIPVYYISFAIPYLVIVWLNDRTNLLNMIKNMFIAMLPILPIGIYAVISISTTAETWTKQYVFKFEEIMRLTGRQSCVYIILYVLSLGFMFLFAPQKRIWQFYFWKTVFMMLIVFNPLTAYYVAKYITGIPVYDRLFLIFSAIFVIPIGIVYLYRNLNTYVKRMSLVVVLLGVFIVGDNHNTFSFFKGEGAHQNIYMIKNEVLEVCEYFEEMIPSGNITMLADYEINRFFRQYSSRYNIIVARFDNIPKDEKGSLYFKTYDEVFVNRKISDVAMEGIDYFGVDFLLTMKPIETENRFHLTYISSDGTIYIYERN